jgi:hypothetical protein
MTCIALKWKLAEVASRLSSQWHHILAFFLFPKLVFTTSCMNEDKLDIVFLWK